MRAEPVAGRLADEGLAAGGGPCDPRREVDFAAEEILPLANRVSRMQTNPDPDGGSRARVARAGPSLDVQGAADTFDRVGEGDHVPVAHALDDAATVLVDGGANDRVVLTQDRKPASVAEFLVEGRRAFYVGEQ